MPHDISPSRLAGKLQERAANRQGQAYESQRSSAGGAPSSGAPAGPPLTVVDIVRAAGAGASQPHEGARPCRVKAAMWTHVLCVCPDPPPLLACWTAQSCTVLCTPPELRRWRRQCRRDTPKRSPAAKRTCGRASRCEMRHEHDCAAYDAIARARHGLVLWKIPRVVPSVSPRWV